MLRQRAAHGRAAKASALVFACPRDNGANALQKIFREGPPSGDGQNANHAITELHALHRIDAAQRQDPS
jgi:hypothetical protein